MKNHSKGNLDSLLERNLLKWPIKMMKSIIDKKEIGWKNRRGIEFREKDSSRKGRPKSGQRNNRTNL